MRMRENLQIFLIVAFVMIAVILSKNHSEKYIISKINGG